MEQTAIAIPVAAAPIRHPKLSEITSMPKPRYKGHWALVTQDLKASEAFYQTLTGAVLMSRPQPTSGALSWDHEHHRFFIADLKGSLAMRGQAPPPDMPPPGERVGEVGGGIRYRSPKALVKVLERMQAIGHEPQRIVDKGAIVSLTYRDPDQLMVDVFAPVAGGTHKAEQVLDVRAFAERFG